MPFLLAEILDFQGSAHLIGVGSLSYLYLYVSNNIWSMIGKATGGAQQHINKDIVNAYPILLPNKDTIIKLNTIVEPMFSKIADLYVQNMRLVESRDRLLPKLMSGEIEV